MKNTSILKTKIGSVFPFLVMSVLLGILLNGCAQRRVLPPPPVRDYPVEQEKETTTIPRGYSGGPANALFQEASQSMAEGAFDKAELSLERALRIEPGNPYYWYTMGKIKYRQRANHQAIQFCLKSKSLAGRDTKLVRINDALIGKIRRDSKL